MLLDTYALLTLFQREPGAEEVALLLRQALDEGVERLLCIINLGEILYLSKRRFGESKKLEILGRINQLGIQRLSASDSLVFRAAELKAEHPISYAGSFALACALEHSAALVTADPESQQVAHLVSVKWVGKDDKSQRGKLT